MTATCSSCLHWLRGTWVSYANTAPQFVPSAPAGAGRCRDPGNPLCDQVTPGEFGCLRHTLGTEADQVIREVHDQADWEIWELVPCPECRPPGVVGEAACHRCAGKGEVPQYRDGYVGDQQTWEHPKAKERRLAREREERARVLRAELESL
jgi:hypothetical protein